MAAAESDMAGRLEQVTLAVRSDLSESDVHRLQGFYGIAAQRSRLHRRSFRDFIAQYPALTLSVLVGHAALAYDHGRYWESFWSELGLARSVPFEQTLRESVESNLERFGLDTFPDLHGRYVQILGVHAGIPIHCMDALVAVAAAYLHRGRDPSGAGLAEWIRRSEKNADVLALAKPVRYFIQFGGAFAIEVLDHIICGLSVPGVGESRNHVGERDIELPMITAEGIRLGLETYRASTPRRTESSAARWRANPALAYSFLDDQVVVDLPATPSDDESWCLSVDGELTTVEPEPRWGIEWYEAPSTRVPVKRPAREIVVEHASSGRVRRLPVVCPSDPVLIFGKDGRSLTDRMALPKTEIIVVHPIDATIVDQLSGCDIEPSAYLGTPTEWAGWRAVMVDLSESMSFRVSTEQGRGTLRGIRVVDPPEVILDDKLVGLTTGSGIPAVGSRPKLRLPGRAGGEESAWHVRVRTESGTVVTEASFAAAVGSQEIDPFGKLDSPLVGLYTIAITGSAGSSLEFTTFILEGVDLSMDRWVRVPAPGGGLSEVTARVSSPPGVRAVHPVMNFASQDIRLPAVFATDEQHHRLFLTPPHVRVHVGESGRPIQWLSSTQVLLHEDLTNSMVVMRIPGCDSLRLELRDSNGDRVKWYCANKRIDDQFEADLRVFVDAVRGSVECELIALAVSREGRIERFAVAKIRPVGTCEGVRIEDSCLVFDGLRVVDDLSASVWWATAPWAPGIELAVKDNQVALPRALRRAGKLLVQLHVTDPWVRFDTPVWPEGAVFAVEQPGYRKDHNNGRERLSKYLAEGGHAPTSEKTMPEIWAVLARTLDDVGDVHASQTRRELLRVVSENPRTALETLGNSTIPASQIPTLVVETEIARESFSSKITLNDLHVNPWVGCMVEIADLESLSIRQGDVVLERSDTLRYLTENGGADLIEILRRGRLPATPRPRPQIMSDIVRLGEQALEQFALVTRSVPSPLLSPDSMWSAYLESFDARDAWLGIDSPSRMLADARHLATMVERSSRNLSDAVEERFHLVDDVFDEGNSWTAIPAFTLVLASLARLEAHQLLTDSLSPGLIATWGRLAARCPNLVTTDLLLAEAIVTHHHYGDLISKRTSEECTRRRHRAPLQ